MIKNKSSSGLDGIDYEMITQLPEEIKKIFLSILNNIWTENKVPKRMETLSSSFYR